ncbi:MAG: hypothetical protein E6Q88_10845 [Lysobacteraceae bacterium]|nr:MAG: hypothetical protein E6Q88_10845 [Xanthomonadaceae bacterium]
MTLRSLKWVLPALLALVLTACVSAGGALQKKGSVTVFDMTMTSGLDWSRIKGRRNEVWTIDGVLLNRLLIFSKIKPNEDVFQRAKERKSRPDGLWYRPGMRLDELESLVADAFNLNNGWAGTRTSNLRPHTFGAVEGIRFDIEMADTDGLLYKGTVAVAERNNFLNVLVWVAPQEYYHARDAVAVNEMLDGMQFK